MHLHVRWSLTKLMSVKEISLEERKKVEGGEMVKTTFIDDNMCIVTDFGYM
jgi:hypothetical protein